jgi:hypothetical protein
MFVQWSQDDNLALIWVTDSTRVQLDDTVEVSIDGQYPDFADIVLEFDKEGALACIQLLDAARLLPASARSTAQLI